MNNLKNISIHWFRQDLRLFDNPGLLKASEADCLMPIYILDDVNSNDYKMGAASKWWLHKSLIKLNESLNNNLSIYKGNPKEILSSLIDRYNIKAIYWNRCYEPWRMLRDKEIKKFIKDKGIEVKTFNASLLWEPWDILKDDGTPYKVFTPFYKKGYLNTLSPRMPLDKPNIASYEIDQNKSLNLNDLNLISDIKWYKEMDSLWNPGEVGALNKLDLFLDSGLSNYKDGRNFPSKNNVSQLSPHIHFGEISPNNIWYSAESKRTNQNIEQDLYHFQSELGWREFSYNLLYYNQNLPISNLQKKFDSFPWQENFEYLDKWKKGLTGYPIVDAGMRELWRTGYMHNRVRMIVGSFLVKNLLLHWKHGERWFWDCLIDADLASNSASWQWIAGTGADAAPYFRIFNPITQGLKFDSEGFYVRKYIPELKNMPNKYLFNPWESPKEILHEADVILGTDYPYPIVDLKESRDKALNAFKSIKVS